ncbi:MAG: ferrous iron transport protein B [Nitrososphaerota archaeon]
MSCHESRAGSTLKARQKAIKIGIIGNPNVGKSVLFNKLTKGKAWVGNWPGVTVEKKVGKLTLDGISFELVDLPGIYGLTAYSQDELIARKFLLEGKPEIVIQVTNAINLERNLYLTIQLLEMGFKLVIALNMADLAEKEGVKIDVDGLRRELRTPIIPTIAVKNFGLNQLIETIKEQLDKPAPFFKIDYGPEIEEAIEKIRRLIDSPIRRLGLKIDPRWLAIRLLEDDNDIVQRLRDMGFEDIVSEARHIRDELQAQLNESVEVLIIEKRYEYLLNLSRKYVRRKTAEKSLTDLTDGLDKVLTHPILGLMVFASILYLLFKFSFDVASSLTEVIRVTFSQHIHDLVKNSLHPEIISSLFVDGVLNGVGTILIFIPNLLFLFIGISTLEDTGYMARVAFLSDRLMNRLGLSGRAMIPLLIGFGCNVPAVMSTRVLGSDRERRLSVFMIPFMSCSARLPIFLLLTLAFFRENQLIVILSMYFLGVFIAVLTALLFNNLFYRKQVAGYVMDMPPYLNPSIRNILAKSWERIRSFLMKAGTIILLMSVVIWVLSVTGPEGYIGPEALRDVELLSRSWIASFSRFLEPLFKPLNWDWRIIASLSFGFIAKEVVVSSLAVLYNVGVESLPTVLSDSLTPLAAYSLMTFALLYTPCMATVATMRNEVGLRYTLLMVLYQLLIAYTAAYLILSIGGMVI